MMFSVKDFFSKCDQIRRKLQIWSHLLKKSIMEIFIFCAVLSFRQTINRYNSIHEHYFQKKKAVQKRIIKCSRLKAKGNETNYYLVLKAEKQRK